MTLHERIIALGASKTSTELAEAVEMLAEEAQLVDKIVTATGSGDVKRAARVLLEFLADHDLEHAADMCALVAEVGEERVQALAGGSHDLVIALEDYLGEDWPSRLMERMERTRLIASGDHEGAAALLAGLA